jgi:L-ascorbate metabolism protein UlaG (beta-lactamase superfamily)
VAARSGRRLYSCRPRTARAGSSPAAAPQAIDDIHPAFFLLEGTMAESALRITWLGHGTVLFTSPAGRRILMDPWLAHNPACPDAWKTIDALDLVLVTHGHFDHVGDALDVARSTGATFIGSFEVCQWLAHQGVEHTSPMNKGGTQHHHGIAISMVQALHSSSAIDEHGTITYLGEAAGYVLRFENGLVVYFAGDTAIFGDMALIKELYAPAIAILPVGDLYTMGPEAASRACDLLGVRQVVPVHHGTFPALTGTPARLRELVAPRGITVHDLSPGQTIDITARA